MESIEKLREWSRLGPMVCQDLLDIADDIEREIAERYMQLPLDADGVPVHVGDEMELDNERFVVCAVAPGCVHRWDIHNIGELDRGTVAYPPGSLHHFKQRTIEDVLQCAGVSVAVIEDVAAEIRELMEVDA